MAVKVYTPGQFYAAGGVVEEMFYQEVGRTKKYLRKRVGFGYTMDFIATPVISFSSGTKPLTFTLAVPAIPREVLARLDFDAALYSKGRTADNIFVGLVINANGNVRVKYFEN